MARESERRPGVTRRAAILGGTGAAAAGMAAACALGGAAADAASAAEAAGGAETAVGPASAPAQFETYESDILIIGTGNAASAAAWSIAREGKFKIAMVDKGGRYACGHSNTSWCGFNMAFDIHPETPLSEYKATWLGKPFSQYLINTPLMRNALNMFVEGGRDHDLQTRAVSMINHGHYLPKRDDTGALIPYVGDMLTNLWVRHEMDEAAARKLVTLYDETMITELLFDGDRCCGACGIYLPTGQMRVFRAKATIVATTGCYANYGSVGAHAYSAGTMDSTFDLEASAYRHGMGIAENEFVQFDVYSVEPEAFACTVGASVLVDAQEARALYRENGEPVFAEDDPNVNDRNYFSQVVGRVLSEDGAIYIDAKGDTSTMYASANSLRLLKEFGYDLSTDRIRAGLDLYEHGGAPLVDEDIMTQKEGLFWTRGAGTYGENGGSCLFENYIFGNYAGYKAAGFARDCDSLPALDMQAAEDERLRLEGLRNEGVSDGLRPHAVRKEICDAFYKAFGAYRAPEDLESSIAELQRIREEDLPRQTVIDPSHTWNREWKLAIENPNLLLSAEMSLRSTYMRQESRGGYLRPDFPEQDDANWGCMISCRDQDGEMVLEKEYLPDPVD